MHIAFGFREREREIVEENLSLRGKQSPWPCTLASVTEPPMVCGGGRMVLTSVELLKVPVTGASRGWWWC